MAITNSLYSTRDLTGLVQRSDGQLNALGGPRGGYTRVFTVIAPLSAAQITAAGHTRLFKFPSGSFLLDLTATPTDLDTGTPAIVYDLVTLSSDGLDTEGSVKIVSGSVNAKAAAGTDSIAAAAKGLFVGDKYLAFKVTTAPATPAAGTITIYFQVGMGMLVMTPRDNGQLWSNTSSVA